MTITELKYIIAVASEGHFGRAAKKSYVSQPTLSIGIKKLEEDLGVQIFERLTNRVVPTQVGLRIIEAAKNTLMSVDTIRAIADEAQGSLNCDIKLGAIYTMCPYLLPKIIPDLRQHAPDIRIYIKEDYTSNLINTLKHGDLDLAIVSLPIPESNLFEVKAITEEDFYVILPKNHSLTKKEYIDVKDLANERLFLLGGGNCFRDQVLSACPHFLNNEADRGQLIEGGSLETIRMMVASGLGISIFPKMALVHNDDISVRPFKQGPKRQIALAWRKSFIQQDVVDAIESSIKRCNYTDS